jgi:hypothetical protein
MVGEKMHDYQHDNMGRVGAPQLMELVPSELHCHEAQLLCRFLSQYNSLSPGRPVVCQS